MPRAEAADGGRGEAGGRGVAEDGDEGAAGRGAGEGAR